MFAFAQPVPVRPFNASGIRNASPQRALYVRMTAAPVKTLVTGASGRTGRLAMEKLVARPEFHAVGMVRALEKGVEAGFAEESLVVGDVGDREGLTKIMDGVKSLIILTSAVPYAVPGEEGKPPQFSFPEDGFPETIDYEGGVNQIEAAKKAGVEHIVLVGSMGSTDDNNPLNRVGPNGNILRWKRKAEQYLISSGINYTVINPGGLLNEAGGERELVISNNDLLYKVFETPSIPRSDVAELTVQAILHSSARNKAMDVVSKAPGTGKITTDFDELFKSAGGDL